MLNLRISIGCALTLNALQQQRYIHATPYLRLGRVNKIHLKTYLKQDTGTSMTNQCPKGGRSNMREHGKQRETMVSQDEPGVEMNSWS